MPGSERWDAAYAAGDARWIGIGDWLVETIKEYEPAPRTALDLGCGTGDKSVWLAGQGYEVTGIDFSEEAIRIARKAAGDKENPTFIRADLSDEDLAFPTNVGLALDLVSVQFLSEADQRKVFDQIAQSLSPGGILVHTRLKADSDASTPWIRELSMTPAGFEESLKGLKVLKHTEHAATNHPDTTVHRYVLKKS